MQLEGMAHGLNCTSNLAAMVYDSSCGRCTKIKRVVFLRRKTQQHGASPQEEQLALAQAEKLRLEFKLTRGEIFDRQYEAPPTKVSQAQHFKQSSTSYNNAVNPNRKYRMKTPHDQMTPDDVW